MVTSTIGLFRPARRITATGGALLREWWLRARTRRELAQLDERALRDIGLDRGQALYEANKPFWQG